MMIPDITFNKIMLSEIKHQEGKTKVIFEFFYLFIVYSVNKDK